MEHIIREFEVCRWPPPKWFIEEATTYLNENDSHLTYKLQECIRVSEFALNLFNTVHDALETIEDAEKKMTSASYLKLIDVMHRLALVGERKSELYNSIHYLAQIAARRMYAV